MSWLPHIYIQPCTVDEPQLRPLTRIRTNQPFDPAWLAEVRRWEAPVSTESVANKLRGRRFVKVGYTYQKDPHSRTNALAHPSLTMECLGVPISPLGRPAYIPGEYALEQALHERWASSRIDPDREFFWSNHEIEQLQSSYAPRPRNRWGQEVKPGAPIR